MKINILNSNFTSLSCAVAYKIYKFIPSQNDSEKIQESFDLIKGGFESSSVKYYGSNDTVLSGQTLTEYNFSQLVEKSKFNDTFLPILLTKNSKELVGRKLGDIEKINKVLFPTLSDKIEDKSFGYFGSTSLYTTLEQILYFIDLLPGEWKLELYENPISENLQGSGKFYDSEFLTLASVDHVDPAVIIYLGVTSGARIKFPGTVESYKALPRTLYFHEENGDPFTDSNYGQYTESIDLVNYKSLFDEVHNNKLIYILFSPRELEEELRIFASISQEDKNLNRNMNKYYLRNDEFFSTREKPDFIGNINGYLFDKRSRTLLGKKNNFSPILDRKRRDIYNNENLWCKYKEYSIGEKVIYGNNTWVSLANNNLGNNPKSSNGWSIYSPEKDKMLKIKVTLDPGYSNSISPTGVIRVKSDILQKFYYNLGEYYEFSDYPLGDGSTFYEIDCAGISGPLFQINTGSNTINVIGYQWEDLGGIAHGPAITGKLVFYLSRKLISVRIRAIMTDGSILDFADWGNIDLKLDKIECIPDNEEESVRYVQSDSISSVGDFLFPMAYNMFLRPTIDNRLYKISGLQIAGKSLSPNTNIPGEYFTESTVLDVFIDRSTYEIFINTEECFDRFIFEDIHYVVSGGDDFKLRFYSPTNEWTQLSDFNEDYRIITYSVDTGQSAVGNLTLDMRSRIFTYTINNIGENYKVIFEKL